MVGLDLDSWPGLDTSGFCEADADWYARHVSAIKLYQAQSSLEDIRLSTRVGRDELYRQIERCLQTAADGRILGFRALKRYRHTQGRREDPRKLSNGSGVSGSLSALLKRYPNVEAALIEMAVHGKHPGRRFRSREKEVPLSAIHEAFLALCIENGISAPSYPFGDGTSSQGRPALREWVKRVRLEHISQKIKSESRGRREDSLPITRPYARVELDAHKIDLQATIELTSQTDEGPIFKDISRLWIITLIEVVSRAILGYSIAYGTNYKQFDVLRAIANSLRPWVPRNIKIPNLGYPSQVGFPTAVDGLEYVCWDELWLDNWSAHFGEHVASFCERVVGCSTVFGPVATPDDRPFQESFYRTLEEAGLHRTPGTTGSNPKDKRRDRSDSALKAHLRDSDVHDIADVLISRINRAEAPSASVSRIDILTRARARDIVLFRQVPPDDRERLLKYDMLVSGHIAKRKGRAVVSFEGQPYDNNDLRPMVLLAGREVTIHANSSDLREIEVYLDDGTTLGIMYPPRRWRATRHGIVTRREAKKLEDKGLIRHVSDVPLAVRHHLEQESQRSKRDATRLARVRAEQGIEDTNSDALERGVNQREIVQPIDSDSVDLARRVLRDEHEVHHY